MQEVDMQENKKLSFVDWYKKIALYINLSVITGLFLLSCFFPWVTIIAYSLVLICTLCCNLKIGLSYVLFSIPFLWLCLPYTAIFFMVALVGYIIKLIILKVKRNEFNFKLSKPTIIFLSLFILYSFIPTDGYFNANMFIKALCLIAILGVILLIIKFPEEIQVKFNLRMIAIGLLCASLMGLLKPYSAHLQEIIELHTVNGYVRYAALFYNTNTLALICEICISIFTYYILSNQCTKRDIFTFITLTTLGFTTFSKTFMIIMAVIVLILFIYAIRSKSKIAWFCIVLIGVETILVTALVPNYLIAYLQRFDIGAVEGNTTVGDALNIITTSRYDLWLEYLQYVVNHPLVFVFGRSLAAPTLSTLAPHNVYISALYQLGVVGTTLFVLALVFLIIDAKKQAGYKFNKSIFSPLLVLALIAFVEDLILTIW